MEVINLENSLNEDEDQLDEENYEEDDTGDRRSPEYALEVSTSFDEFRWLDVKYQIGK